MTTTIESFRVDDSEHPVSFEENPDLTVHLSRGGQRQARCAERGTVLVYLGVNDWHDEVQVRPLPAHPNIEMLTQAIERLTTVRDELRRLFDA